MLKCSSLKLLENQYGMLPLSGFRPIHPRDLKTWYGRLPTTPTRKESLWYVANDLNNIAIALDLPNKRKMMVVPHANYAFQ